MYLVELDQTQLDVQIESHSCMSWQRQKLSNDTFASPLINMKLQPEIASVRVYLAELHQMQLDVHIESHACMS
jgi:hypothetical protein